MFGITTGDDEVAELSPDVAALGPEDLLLDSGSCINVAPLEFAPNSVLEKGACMRARAANGEQLRHHGQKRVSLTLAGSLPAQTSFEIADVTRPMLAISRLCDQGVGVVFRESGGSIHFPSDHTLKFARRVGQYFLPAEVNDIEEDFDQPLGQEEARPITNPVVPNDGQVEKHICAGHVPYANWCKECVAGRGRDDPHRSRAGIHDKHVQETPVIFCDYLVGKLGGDGSSVTVLCAIDRSTGFGDAAVVDKKGHDDWATKWLQAYLKSLAYEKLVVLHDKEPH